MRVPSGDHCGSRSSYGPEETTNRPYSPALVKHWATSFGIGIVAGIANRYGKSPTGWFSVKMIVLSSGVEMPEIDVALPFSKSLKPLIAGS